MQQNKHYISIHNFIDKSSEIENEDAVKYFEDDNIIKIAMSDGAGGAGIYCKHWAEYLVDNQPEQSFKKDLETNEWFLSTSKLFYKENIELINKSDPFILEKFNTEGSYATIMYVWLQKNINQLSYTGIGDTTLFIFREINNDYSPILITPINEQKNLNDFPKLVNWNKSLSYDLKSKVIDIQPTDILIICTDSLSRWLIYNLLILSPSETQDLLNNEIINNISNISIEQFRTNESYENLSDLLSKIEQVIKEGSEYFQKVISKKIKLNQVEKDDFSILFKRI